MVLVLKNPPANAGRHKRHGFNPWVGKIHGGGHSNPASILACSISWTKEPGRLQSIELQGRTHWSDLALTRVVCVELFQILKDDAVKVLHSICQQIWKTQQWPQDWKRSVFIPIPKKGNAKECSNYRKIALISYASKVMLKNSRSQASAIREPWTSRCSSWF